MRAYVRVIAPDGSRHDLVHGDLIGRLWCAALPIDDARISEAHAMVSLREQELRLIALRGAFAVEGRPRSEIALVPGMEILLARGLTLEVEHVSLPGSVLALQGERLARQTLPSVCSVIADPHARLASGFVEGAAAWIWCTGPGWRLKLAGQEAQDLGPGVHFTVGGERLTAVDVPLAAAGQAATRPGGGVAAPLRIVANFDTVHLHREHAEVMVLGGVPARIVSELVALGGPAHWTLLAEQLWPRESEPDVVRARLDVNLSRLRRKLREARIRADLVHTDGAGRVELLLYPGDVVEDHN